MSQSLVGQSAVCAAAQGKYFEFLCNLLRSKTGIAQNSMPVYWMEKYITEKNSVVLEGGGQS